MQFFINCIFHTCNLDPHIKLKISNTFFALTIASYYLLVHHTPQLFHWSPRPNFYEIRCDMVGHQPQLQACLPLGSAIIHPIFPKQSLAFYTNFQYSSSTYDPEMLLVASCLVPSSTLQTSQTHFEGLMKKETHISPRFDRLPLMDDDLLLLYPKVPFFEKISLQNLNFPLFSQIHETNFLVNVLIPSSPIDDPTLILPFNNSRRVSLTHNEESASTNKFLSSYFLKNNIYIPPVEAALQLDEKFSSREEKVKVSPIVHASHPRINTLKPWHTYITDSKNPLLNLWLMKLAPESTVPQIEIPYRKALVETLLLPEYQPYVSLSWEEDELDIQKIRAKFCLTYMDKIDWAATRFQRLYLTPEKDLHLVKEAAYMHAYDFPLKRGIQLYKDEDFATLHSAPSK